MSGGVAGTLTCATMQQPVKYQGDRQVNDSVSPQVIGSVIESESFRGFSLLLSILTITLPSHPFFCVADSRKWKCATFKHVMAHFTFQYVSNDMTNEEVKDALNQVPPSQRIPFSAWACCLSLKCSLSLKWTVWAWCLHIWLPEGSVERSCATRLFLLIQREGLWFGQTRRSAVSLFLMDHEPSRNVPVESLSFCTAEL